MDYLIRGKIFRIAVVVAALCIIARLFYLQVLDRRYKEYADNNVLRHEVLIPPRGEVLDRNGEFLVQNRESYDLMAVPNNIKEFDTLLMCGILGVDKEDMVKALQKAKNHSWRVPSILFRQLTKEVKLRLDERSFPGFYSLYRPMRSYPRNMAGNLLGYIGEVGPRTLERNPYYKTGDYVGELGIESDYEVELRGNKGVEVQMVDVHGVAKGSYAEGKYDSLASPGLAVTSTIDAGLQQFTEELLEGKVGAVIAIEPSTGEILVMANSPTFDPDRMVGPERGKNYSELANDPRKPMLNRAVMSAYPPGSTFKLVNALIGLQEGVLTPSTTYPCYGGYTVGRFMACHNHRSPVDLSYAIQTSCNPYFCNVYRNIVDNRKYGGVKEGFDVWRDYVMSFGFGRKLDSDFRNELNGFIPTREFYDKQYNGRWNSITNMSVAIGQEVNVTALQMANFIATIANRGYYYIPHVVKAVEGRDSIDTRFYEKHYTKVDTKYFDIIAQAMWRAVNEEGTATGAYLDHLDVCGKTGTAQTPPWEDNSTFACFAPLNDPKIAVLVYVEHGGFGASTALPIAKLLMERHLTGTISNPQEVQNIKSKHISYPMYDRQRRS